jgi:hypothetical protein
VSLSSASAGISRLEPQTDLSQPDHIALGCAQVGLCSSIVHLRHGFGCLHANAMAQAAVERKFEIIDRALN